MTKVFTHDFAGDGRIIGHGKTAHQAKLNAIDKARDAIRGFTYPEAVSWRGRTRFIHHIPHDGIAVAYLGDDGSIGSHVSYSHNDWAAVVANVRLDLAQLGATDDEIEHPERTPAILHRSPAMIPQWETWARWQSAYRHARSMGHDDESARKEADFVHEIAW